MKKQIGELLSEIIKRKIPTSIEQKLRSYQKNRMQWMYYGFLINQEQNELRLLDLKAWQGYYSLHDFVSRDKHQKTLSEYQNEQFKYFRSMCCDALDFVNEWYKERLQSNLCLNTIDLSS